MTDKTIYFVSDLHLDFNIRIKKLLDTFPKAYFLVIAGNICPVYKDQGKLLKTFLNMTKETDKYKHIIFIAGNHEYYGSQYKKDEVLQILKNVAEETQTHFLQRERKVIDDIEFIGVTMWSRIEAMYQIGDFRCGVFKNKEDYIKEYVFDTNFLRETLEKKAEYPRVVITHHKPLIRLKHPRFANSLLNSPFVTDRRLYTYNLSNVRYLACEHSYDISIFKNETLLVSPIGYKSPNFTFFSQLFEKSYWSIWE